MHYVEPILSRGLNNFTGKRDCFTFYQRWELFFHGVEKLETVLSSLSFELPVKSQNVLFKRLFIKGLSAARCSHQTTGTLPPYLPKAPPIRQNHLRNKTKIE
jgi:hypothetical protein